MPAKESKKVWGVWMGPESWRRVGAAEMSILQLGTAGLAGFRTRFLQVMAFYKGEISSYLNFIKPPLCRRGGWAGGGVVSEILEDYTGPHDGRQHLRRN